MPEATSVLFGIEDEFDVVERRPDRSWAGKIIIEMRSREAPARRVGCYRPG